MAREWWEDIRDKVYQDSCGIVRGETDIFWVDEYSIIRDLVFRRIFWMEGATMMHYTFEKTGEY